MTLVHATCVAIDGAGVLIRGPSGSGKSDLALRLIDEGAILVADDYCTITAKDDRLLAQTPETIAGKLEVRGYGIVTLPHELQADVWLVVDLESKDNIERLPETSSCTLNGMVVRRLYVDAETVSSTAKVRLALKVDAENMTQGVRQS